MAESIAGLRQLAKDSRRVARRLLIIGENRLELLAVEVQEERERLLHALLLAIGVAALGLLASMTLTALVVVLLWPYAPVTTLVALTCLYGGGAACLWWRLTELMRDWNTLSASLEQFRKDRACLEKILV